MSETDAITHAASEDGTRSRYQKIVVPLDGSAWSQSAIPHAADIAKHHGSEIILVHVFRAPASEYVDQLANAGQSGQVDQIREDLKQQMVALRSQLRNRGINCRCQFIEGAGVANLLCDYINEEEVDLVVMSSHGRTGLRRFIFGSVANKLLQEVRVPVLLIRPGQTA